MLRYRIVNESTGERFRVETLVRAQEYRDERDFDEFVAVYSIGTGNLIAESAVRSCTRRESTDPISNDDLLAVLENVQITDSYGLENGTTVISVPRVTATDDDGAVLDFGPDVSKNLLRKAALLKLTRDGGNGHIDESWRRGESMPESTTGTLDPNRAPGQNRVDYEFCDWGVKLAQTYVLPSDASVADRIHLTDDVDRIYLTNGELRKLAKLAQQRGVI